MPHTKLIDRKKVRKELVQLITTLQKETWDQACKAQREPSKYKIGIDWEKRIAGVEFIEPPFNPNL